VRDPIPGLIQNVSATNERPTRHIIEEASYRELHHPPTLSRGPLSPRTTFPNLQTS
jgi:hypothetical protein